MNIIHYQTEEFIDFEKNAKFKKEDAWRLYEEYCENPNEEFGSPLYFVVNGNYVFSKYVRPKMNQAMLSGVWVNAKTGKVQIVKDQTEWIQSKGYYWRGELDFSLE